MNSVGGIFHNESVYKIITLYTLSILQFCQLYLSKAEKKKTYATPFINRL